MLWAVGKKESNGWISVKMLIKFSPLRNLKKILCAELDKLKKLSLNLLNIQHFLSLLKKINSYRLFLEDINK